MSRQTQSLIIGPVLLALVSASAALAQDDRPAADFDPEGLYVSIDVLKREMDRGADFILLDARSRPNFLIDHITSAISMPFYEAEERFEELPQDKWIVAYCSCPRAEAERAVETLQEKGYEKLKVLYDGYLEWRERGYPVTAGEGGTP